MAGLGWTGLSTRVGEDCMAWIGISRAGSGFGWIGRGWTLRRSVSEEA